MVSDLGQHGGGAMVFVQGWHSYHLVYHGDRDHALSTLITPLVGKLWAEGKIDRFFFIRYSLGGPHLRLRLRVICGWERAVAERIQSAAANFFAQFPSSTSVDLEQIRRVNRSILAHDAYETEDVVYANHSMQQVPFRPEVERYGGPELLAASLDVFALSSVAALRFLVALLGKPRSQFLAAALQLLARSCWSFATGPEESAYVLDAFIASRGLAPILEHGVRAYDKQREPFRELVRHVMEELAEGQPEPTRALTCGMQRLSYEFRDTDTAVRRRIGWSHMHMTANRIGLSNAEEVYLGKILEQAMVDLAATEPAWWVRVWQALGERRAITARERLDQIVSCALEEQFARNAGT
jgi:thiopeptide-type bacteriocin biosynthesis protein